MRKRLLFTYIALVFVTLMASQISFWSSGQRFLQQQSEAQYTDQAELIRDVFEQTDFAGTADYDAFAKKYARRQEVRITIIDMDGTVLGESEESPSDMENHKDREEVKKAMTGESASIVRRSSTLGMDYCYCAVPVRTGSFEGVLRVSVPLEELHALRLEYMRSTIFMLAIGVLLIAGLVIAFTRFIADPIDEVIEAAGKIAEGSYGIRLKTRQNSQIGKLADSFNWMSGRLEAAVKELKDRNNELEAILRSMRNGVLAINGRDEILFYNDALMNLIGHRGDFLGESVYHLVRSSLIFDVIEKVRESRDVICEEGQSRIMGEQYLRITGTVLNREKEQSRSVLLIIEDITDVKKLENMRSDFVSNVTHELKTPLTSIRGFVDTLKQGAIKDEQYARKFLDIIDIEAERLYTLIQDILLLSEIESGSDYNIQDCDVNGIIDETLNLLQPKIEQKPEVDVIFQPEPYIRPFPCNPDRMKQLFINLIDNAVKNTEKGSVTVTCRVHNDHLMISVKDTGIGIPKEHLSRIFERFYRVDKGRSRKMGGTGLGLSIVKHIVEMYEGDIFVSSEVGEGTEFIIKLPYDRKHTGTNVVRVQGRKRGIGQV
ncbi:GHKL domain-containing protein [Oscillospiraceae bacterium Marseille-Q3528]|nr:GHKL domain-containing protein [Oscillospiraceae bacterium Marseille-Q3528]